MVHPEYTRGYRTGRKKTEAEMARVAAAWAKEMEAAKTRWDMAYCAALQGLIASGGWSMDGKKITTLAEYAELARRFANATPGAVAPK